MTQKAKKKRDRGRDEKQSKSGSSFYSYKSLIITNMNGNSSGIEGVGERSGMN